MSWLGIIPGSMMTWQEWFCLLSKCSVIWSAPEASARKSHLRHTSVRLLKKKKKKKKTLSFSASITQINSSITVNHHILDPNLPQTMWRLPHLPKPYFRRIAVKPADEQNTIYIWLNKFGIARSSKFSPYLTICCLKAFWQLDLNLHILHLSNKG